MLQRFIIIFLFFMISVPATAGTVSCPWKKADVTLEGGPLQTTVIDGKELIHRLGMEPDIGGDYDENAPQYEWNFLNSDKYTTPSIAHCFSKTKPQKTADVEIPVAIRRCIQPKGGEFTCRSETISCVGYIDSVQIEVAGKDSTPYQLPPSATNENGKRLVWKLPDNKRNGVMLVAHCSEKSLPKSISIMEIPDSMKECALMNRRFRCTEIPDQHNLFWPKE